MGERRGVESGERRIDAQRPLPWFERAVQLEAQNYWYQYYLAFAYQMRGRSEKAMDHYNIAADLNAGSPWVHFSRARLYHSSFGNWKRAIEDLDEALSQLRDRPEARQVHLELGLVYQSLGDDRTARDYFREVIRSDPTDWFGRAARLDLANGQAGLGQASQAAARPGELLTPRPDGSARSTQSLPALMLLRSGRV